MLCYYFGEKVKKRRMLDAASRQVRFKQWKADCLRVGPEHNSKDADQEEDAERDVLDLSERKKTIATVQRWKSRPPLQPQI